METDKIDPLEVWKKNNPNRSLNEYYRDFSEKKFEKTTPENITSNYVKESNSLEKKPLYKSAIAKIFIVAIIIIALFRYEYIGEKINQVKTFIAKKTNTVKDPDGFNETSFSSREEEVAYIREYMRYKFITEKNGKFDNSKNGLREYASLMSAIFIGPKIEEIMSEVVRQDLNITQAKEKVRGILKEMDKKEAEREAQNRAREESQEDYRERQDEKYREEARKHQFSLESILNENDNEKVDTSVVN